VAKIKGPVNIAAFCDYLVGRTYSIPQFWDCIVFLQGERVVGNSSVHMHKQNLEDGPSKSGKIQIGDQKMNLPGA